MILNCAIIDEDPEALQLLEQYIEKTPTLHLIGAYKSAIDAVDGIHHNHLDILFLAIHMQQISGLELAKVVPKNVKIVFTTAFKEYAIEAYKVNAFDYLLKPITYDDFMGSCQKVFESYMQDDNYNPIKRDGFLVVKRDYKLTATKTTSVSILRAGLTSEPWATSNSWKKGCQEKNSSVYTVRSLPT